MKNKTRLSLFFYFLTITLAESRLAPARLTARPACPFPQAVPNGSFRLRRFNQVMRVTCLPGFQLQGNRILDCVNGKWIGPKPVCAKSGCKMDEVSTPEHGIIQNDSPYRIVLFCLDNYNLAGNRYAYCNGTGWDRPIGNCREPSYNVEHECDFETDDICGWVHEEGIGTQWKRVTAMNIYTSYHTGPRHDHTLSSIDGGHYMLMETVDPTSQPAYLQSPIYEHDLSLKTACCFRFFYFMYGAGVGDLSVFVRPISVKISELIANREKYEKFHKSGNQNNLWNEAHFKISELDEDFQIVFVATAGKNHLSDIAIDDVRLMFGEDCTALDEDNSASVEEEVTEETLFDTQSCDGRCSESSGSGFLRHRQKLFGRCNCDLQCEIDDTCCPDFRLKCLDSIFMQSTELGEETSISTKSVTIPYSTTIKTRPTPPLIKITPSTSTTSTIATTPSTTTKRTTSTTTTTTTTITKTTTAKPITTTTPSTTTTPKTTATTPRPTTPSTTTFKPSASPKFVAPTPHQIPNKNSVNKTNHSTKEEIAVWKKRTSSTKTQDLPHTGRILLITFFLVIITILSGTLIYRFKGRMANYFGVAEKGGDVETTSIRTKFRFNPKFSQRTGQRSADDTDNLLGDDIDAENEANFGIGNKLAIGKATKTKTTETSSTSTNL